MDIPNSERAAIANEANADASSNPCQRKRQSESERVMTICQTKSNPYNSSLYKVNRNVR